MMGYILTGGFAKGYRTYIFMGLAGLTAVANWAVGDMSTSQTLNTLWELFASGGIAALRAARN